MKRNSLGRMIPLVPLGLAVILTVGICGCGDSEVPDPPVARSELVARLFDALKTGRLDEARSLTEKLQALDNGNVALAELKSRIIANGYVLRCQRELDAGRPEQALAIVREGRKAYPLHPFLRVLEEELARLTELRDAAQSLAAAQTAGELSAALERIAPLAAAYPSAKELQLDIERRRADLKRWQADPAAVKSEAK